MAMRPDAFDEIERALAAQGLRRRIALALPHWSAAVEVLAGTDLILTVASRAVGLCASTRHCASSGRPWPSSFDYQQAWHSRKDSDPGHRWLRETVWACSQPGR